MLQRIEDVKVGRSSLDQEIIDKIVRLRKKYTATSIAKILGVSVTTVHKYVKIAKEAGEE